MDSLNVQDKEMKLGRRALLPNDSPSSSTCHWPHKYGMHPVNQLPVPPPPEAWALIESAISNIIQSGHVSARDALLPHLTPPVYAVLSTSGPLGDRCQLTPYHMGARFRAPELNDFVAKLFESVAAAAALQPDLPMVNLSRYDLFHAHLFLGECYSRDNGLGPSIETSIDLQKRSGPTFRVLAEATEGKSTIVSKGAWDWVCFSIAKNTPLLMKLTSHIAWGSARLAAT
eukprot:CAMPEP_0202357798 /NCGR_PEP_ID=MMETSP1126-20121109/11684_1 /ASSEMBLY_ACC=CAM_ASM_000457 /TAXON_ID=3047 /ORGANISM="Dunaliella tertiolecta, Strain CCMP1320" /LENGTH=228 /DNA_ID=CAMNT_0048950757 /DNA_START=236 /DNA_END=923 /DNA_ORIENTATION=-